ncbi:MAG: phosphoribosyltransferase [Gammaproteobacteria bacterium]
MQFKDRHEAGKALAKALLAYKQLNDAIVLGLPRGGVVMAYEIAVALKLPLDVFLVRKLGVPGQEELAFGAIASGGITYLNEDIVRSCAMSESAKAHMIQQEQKELIRRDQVYRQGREFPDLQDKTVILVDDGIATGATLLAAVRGLRKTQQPDKIITAVPVAPSSAVKKLRSEVDKMICLLIPEFFSSIGQFYVNFEQVEDEEVLQLLKKVTDI